MQKPQQDQMQKISMTRELLVKIKNAYFQAKAQKAESFMVGQMEFNTAFAGYFLEYHAPSFGVRFNKDTY